ncbi:MAG: hypothetical protein II078_10560 [Muribaculaceae bacterium]|nr:hypothetical protein [Muribaculaceae bacterium]
MTIAIVLGLSMTTFAEGGGLFQRGVEPEGADMYTRGGSPGVPGHGESTNQDGNQTPIGTGIAVLTALGAAYLVGKKRNEE